MEIQYVMEVALERMNCPIEDEEEISCLYSGKLNFILYIIHNSQFQVE